MATQAEIEALRKEDNFKDLPVDQQNNAIKNLIKESGLFSQPLIVRNVSNEQVTMMNNANIAVGSQFQGQDGKLYRRESENTVVEVQ